jgi:hypothetical protein
MFVGEDDQKKREVAELLSLKRCRERREKEE